MPEIKKTSDIVIYHDDRYYCGPGPSAVHLPDGRIIAVFRRAYNWVSEGIYAHGFPSTKVCLTISEDMGRTWSTPRIFSAGNITNQNLSLLPDGTLLCLSHRGELVPLKVYERLKDKFQFHADANFGWVYASHGIQVMRSTDTGLTWEGPFFIFPVPDTEPILPGWPSPAGLRASAIPLDDGGVGVAVYGLLRGDGNPSNVWFMVSEDSGMTWAPRGRIANDPDGQYYYNETGIYQCESSKLVAFTRVEHDPDSRLHTSVSHDRGHTWTPIRREKIKGYPYQAARMRSGHVLLAYGYRFEPRGIRACLLDTECEGLDETNELVLRNDGGVSDLGYPHVLPLPDGTALITYYHNTGSGTRHVAASIVAEI